MHQKVYHCNTSKNNLGKADDFSLSVMMANVVEGTQDVLFGLNCISPSKSAESASAFKRQIRKVDLTDITSLLFM